MARSATAGGLRRGTASVVLVGLLGAGVLTAGCSGGNSGGTQGSKLVASPRASEMLARSKQVAAKASAVVVDGQLVVNGEAMSVSLRAGGNNAEGTISLGGGLAEARLFGGQLYLNGDGVFWEALKAGSSENYADCWVKTSQDTGKVFAQVLELIPVPAALDRLAPGNEPRAEVTGQTVNGEPTVGLRSLVSGHEDIVYVAQRGTSYPLHVQLATGGSLSFHDWGMKAAAPAVPDEPVVDLSQQAL